MPEQRTTDFPIHALLVDRWSPYAFDDKCVSAEDLRSLFEAARWAPSSYNAQPWHYIVATKEHPEEFGRLLSCLVEVNQMWAKAAPALALGVVKLEFSHNNQPNRAAAHDLGLATGGLLMEASARGLYVHQMIGILPEKARQVYAIPEGFEAWTGIAIGYLGDPAQLPEELAKRDRTQSPRKPLKDFIFSETWGQSSALTSEE